jgi:hypothetical protein
MASEPVLNIYTHVIINVMSCSVAACVFFRLHMQAMKAAACMRQNMCTADHNNPSLYYRALPCPHIILAAYM